MPRPLREFDARESKLKANEDGLHIDAFTFFSFDSHQFLKVAEIFWLAWSSFIISPRVPRGKDHDRPFGSLKHAL
jgi:hypothetical protein